ncbi:hypothetical protein [Paenibacillus hexagrammi]|uniref:Uncharacterized protein n=1 Tax=Paenibacillus hexagrammi TaxID=2908839 RepID=A0ABY3SPS8_9BACL|nr:hypothetical protein [Paenibacillus sp. YPD9-1]UJF35689.1 hypothetical protein L0M14_11715 [Paenibacillus sp. YPD9-1]
MTRGLAPDMRAGFTCSKPQSWNEGYHYIVESKYGYNKASGKIILPWGVAFTHTAINLEGKRVQNEVPYIMFGIYTTTHGVDAGVFYDSGPSRESTGTAGYYIFLQGGPDVGFLAGSVRVPTGYPLSLVVIEQNNAVDITVFQRTTTEFKQVAHENWTIPTTYRFTASGGNTRLTRETSFAQHCGGESDSYMLGTTWEEIYLYNNSGYSLWTPTLTLTQTWKLGNTAVTEAAAADYAKKYNYAAFYNDQEDIDYRPD